MQNVRILGHLWCSFAPMFALFRDNSPVLAQATPGAESSSALRCTTQCALWTAGHT